MEKFFGGLASSLLMIEIPILYIGPMPVIRVIHLFLNCCGTIFLAAVYTPIGLTPPQGNFYQRIKWFFKPLSEGVGVPVHFNQWMSFCGLFCYFLAAIISQFIL